VNQQHRPGSDKETRGNAYDSADDDVEKEAGGQDDSELLIVDYVEVCVWRGGGGGRTFVAAVMYA
jgi:hypothetical protein